MDVSGTFSVKVEFGDAEATNLAKGSVSVRADQGGSLSARALVFKPIFSGESDGGFFVTEPSMSMPKRPSTTKKLSVRVDKIQQNMDMEQYNPYNLTERREIQKIKLDENIQNALRNKVEIIRQKRNRHFALMVKNDVKKKLRDIIDDNDNQELLKTRIKEEWMAVVCLAQMGKGLFQMLLKQREVEKERQRKLKIAISLITKVRKFQKFKGKNTNERLTLDIRMALTFRALFSQGNRIKEDQDEKVLKAEDTLVKFLQDSRVVYAIQSKFNVVIETISKVQNAWRDYARRKEGFSTLLSKLWDRNYERIFVTISKGDYVPSMVAKVFDFKSYLKKMFWSDMRGDEQAKDKFIEDYIKVCRERYIKAYDLYDAQKKQIDKKEKNKLTFLELLKTQPTLKALHMSKMQGKTAKGKTRLSIMNEIEGSSRQDLDSEEGSMILKSEPPKMFILPAAEELDEAIANSIAQQIIATLPRSELIKFSFNEKLDNKN